MGFIKRLWHSVTGSLKGKPSPATTGTPSAPVQTQAKLDAPTRPPPPAASADKPQQQPAQSTTLGPSQAKDDTDASVDAPQDTQAPTSEQPAVGSESIPVTEPKPADATTEAATVPAWNDAIPEQENGSTDGEDASTKEAKKSKRYSLPVGGIARLRRLSKVPARKEFPTTTAPVAEETEPENTGKENQEQIAAGKPAREQPAVEEQQDVPPVVSEQPPVLPAVNIEDTQPESTIDTSPSEDDNRADQAGKPGFKEPSTDETVKSDALDLLYE